MQHLFKLLAISGLLLSAQSAIAQPDNLQPIEELPPYWRSWTEKHPAEPAATVPAPSDVCENLNSEAAAQCLSAVHAESGKLAVEPVRLYIQAALAESNPTLSEALVSRAAKLAVNRMTPQAFADLVTKQVYIVAAGL